jgi:uncharacterized repeat protein (TIGR04138 family)
MEATLGLSRKCATIAHPRLRGAIEWATFSTVAASMDEHDFGEVINQIRKDDPRYERRAYFFLRDALDHTVGAVRKAEAKSGKKRESNHVSGPELLEGIRDYALAQFGPMTHLVLSNWGVTRCGDFGEMVYQLIEQGVFSKTESDRKEDFSEIFDFEETFVKPFQPKKRRLPSPPLASSEVL